MVSHKLLMGMLCMGMLSTAPTSKTFTEVEQATAVARSNVALSAVYGYSPVFAARYVGSYRGVTPLCASETRIDLYRGGELMWQCSQHPDEWKTGTWQTNVQGRAIRLNASQRIELHSSSQGLVGQTEQGQPVVVNTMANMSF